MKKLLLPSSFKKASNIEMEQPTAKAQAPKNTRKKSENTLPKDVYKDEIEPQEVELNDKAKLVFSVKRDGEEGLPHVDIRLYMTTPTFEGFTKKGVNFPLEKLRDVLMIFIIVYIYIFESEIASRI